MALCRVCRYFAKNLFDPSGYTESFKEFNHLPDVRTLPASARSCGFCALIKDAIFEYEGDLFAGDLAAEPIVLAAHSSNRSRDPLEPNPEDLELIHIAIILAQAIGPRERTKDKMLHIYASQGIGSAFHLIPFSH
jgi:hypothetical protein